MQSEAVIRTLDRQAGCLRCLFLNRQAACLRSLDPLQLHNGKYAL
jgi:hypothetical protein